MIVEIPCNNNDDDEPLSYISLYHSATWLRGSVCLTLSGAGRRPRLSRSYTKPACGLQHRSVPKADLHKLGRSCYMHSGFIADNSSFDTVVLEEADR